MRILIAEDDRRLLKSLLHIFKTNKYLADGVANGTDALQYALTGNYDGLVLDIMMPEMNGIDLLHCLRSRGISTPALFLSARTEVYQRIEGLDAGADDYLPKPFSPAELLARVRAMLRRKDNYQPDLLVFNGLTLNRSSCTLFYGENSLSLSGREYQIMEMLMQHPRFVVTPGQLMAHVWGWDSEVDVSVVWVHISNIRKKLAFLEAPVEIRFLRGTGYLLETVIRENKNSAN